MLPAPYNTLASGPRPSIRSASTAAATGGTGTRTVCGALYCTALYCTVLYCTVLYRYGDPDSVWCLQPGPFTMQTDPAQCHYGSNHTAAAARVQTQEVTNLQLSWDHYR